MRWWSSDTVRVVRVFFFFFFLPFSFCPTDVASQVLVYSEHAAPSLTLCSASMNKSSTYTYILPTDLILPNTTVPGVLSTGMHLCERSNPSLFWSKLWPHLRQIRGHNIIHFHIESDSMHVYNKVDPLCELGLYRVLQEFYGSSCSPRPLQSSHVCFFVKAWDIGTGVRGSLFFFLLLMLILEKTTCVMEKNPLLKIWDASVRVCFYFFFVQ